MPTEVPTEKPTPQPTQASGSNIALPRGGGCSPDKPGTHIARPERAARGRGIEPRRRCARPRARSILQPYAAGRQRLVERLLRGQRREHRQRARQRRPRDGRLDEFGMVIAPTYCAPGFGRIGRLRLGGGRRALLGAAIWRLSAAARSESGGSVRACHRRCLQRSRARPRWQTARAPLDRRRCARRALRQCRAACPTRALWPC